MIPARARRQPFAVVATLLLIIGSVGTTAAWHARAADAAPGDPPTSFRGLNPARLLDTRPGMPTIDGQQSGTGAIGTDQTLTLPVTGRGGVPTTGVGAVALNITVTEPTDAGFVTVWPTDSPRPTASNLNHTAGQTTPNLVITHVGTDGQINLYNSNGTTHLIADVLGWFPLTAPTTSSISASSPSPLFGVAIGSPAPAALAQITAALGPPDNDTGWVTGCPFDGADERFLDWGSLRVAFFGPTATEPGSLRAYTIIDRVGGGLSPADPAARLTLPPGVAFGAPISAAATALGRPAVYDAIFGFTSINTDGFEASAAGDDPDRPLTRVSIPFILRCD